MYCTALGAPIHASHDFMHPVLLGHGVWHTTGRKKKQYYTVLFCTVQYGTVWSNAKRSQVPVPSSDTVTRIVYDRLRVQFSTVLSKTVGQA